jgi:hypothetical protein
MSNIIYNLSTANVQKILHQTDKCKMC